MRVLLVEDHGYFARAMAQALAGEHNHEVALASDPLDAERQLLSGGFEVAVVDILYGNVHRRSARRGHARSVDTTESNRWISGLHVLRLISDRGLPVKPVVWTAGESNRQLHIMFAYEELGARVFCSKGPSSPGPLNAAIVSAAAGIRYVDPILSAYLPANGPSLRATILRDPQRRRIWRALALGCLSRTDIREVTHYSRGHIGNLVSQIYSEDLTLLDPGLPENNRSPLGDLIRYAAQNSEFLLDETVRTCFP
jgi:DNA-binding NarL/FixJ family response regulator